MTRGHESQGVLPHALEYLTRGWSVIPTRTNKKSIGAWKIWQAQRMTDAQARTNFKRAEVAGLAVVCGAVSNVTVLDIEAHALERECVKAWLELAGNAPRARSGGGGLHLYFSFAGEANKPLNVDGVHLGDVKSEGGYVILPPSSHPSGNPYRWEAGQPQQLEPMPESLKAMLEALDSKPAARPAQTPAPAAKQSRTLTGSDPLEAYVKAALEKECDAVRHAPEGTGNITLNKAAFALGQFVAAGALSESTARDALENAAGSWAKLDGGAGATIDSGLSAGRKEPRDLSQVGQNARGAGSADDGGAAVVSKHSPLYAVVKGAFSKLEQAKGDSPAYYRALCNFTARITSETLRDDGSGAGQALFTLEGALASGQPLPRIDVPSTVYGAMNWPTALWGARVTIQPTQNTRSVLAHGIQTLSIEAGLGSRRVYTHTGWRNLEPHGWVYLHAGGAISANGLETDLEIDLGDLHRYALPAPLEGAALHSAIHSSLELLDLAPDAVTLPLWLSIWRAALGVTRFSVYLYGVTGEAKSGLAALYLSHYGQFARDKLPANWSSTVTSLERLLFTLKDAPCVIDDFNPQGTQQEAKAMHSKAERVLRGQGNGSARQRSYWGKGGSLESGVSYVPRGLCIVTGEDIPAGHSLRARNLILELGRGDVKKERFARANEIVSANVLAGSMAAYLQWLAPNLEQYQARLESQATELANTFQAAHGRTTDTAGDLMAALDVWGAFALETGCMTAQQFEALSKRARVALQIACGAQAAHQAAADPVHRFLELLPALFSSGKAHLQDSRTGAEPNDAQRWGWRERTLGTGDNQRDEWQALGACVGWVSEAGAVMLEAQSVYAAAQRLAGEQGDGFTKSALSLWKALGERGLIVKDGGQNTVKRSILGQKKRVLCLQPHALEVSDNAALEIPENADPPTLPHSRDFRDAPQLNVLHNLEGVPAEMSVPAKIRDTRADRQSQHADLERAVPELNQGLGKVRDGLGAVQHNVKTAVPEVPAVQHPTPVGFLEDDKVLI